MTSINDRVRITRAVGERRARTDGGGIVGTVEKIRPASRPGETLVYSVRAETGFLHSAYDVVRISQPTPTPAPEPEAPVLIDQARAQALYAASVVLGGHEHALAEDVVLLAGFILNGTAVRDEVIVNANAEPAEALAAMLTRPDMSRRFHHTDSHGDSLTITRGDFGRHSSRVLATIRTSDGSSANPVDVYLRTPAERDELVAYLQAL